MSFKLIKMDCSGFAKTRKPKGMLGRIKRHRCSIYNKTKSAKLSEDSQFS